MSALIISSIIFALMVGGICLGMLLRRTLPENHLNGPAALGQGARHQPAGTRVGKDAHRLAQGDLSVVGQVLLARGYKLKVKIVDFLAGLPGDIGMTLRRH